MRYIRTETGELHLVPHDDEGKNEWEWLIDLGGEVSYHFKTEEEALEGYNNVPEVFKIMYPQPWKIYKIQGVKSMSAISEQNIRKIFREITEPNEHIRGVVMVRTKDGHKKTKIIKRYTFNSLEKFIEKQEEIFNLCDKEQARFYLNPTVKSYEDISYDLLKAVTDNIRNKVFEPNKKVYDSVADKNKGVWGKRVWIIDFDNKNKEEVIKIFHSEKAWESIKYFGENRFYFNETPSGWHVLVKPHQIDLEELNKLAEKLGCEVEVKKNAMTPVYIGKK